MSALGLDMTTGGFVVVFENDEVILPEGVFKRVRVKGSEPPVEVLARTWPVVYRLALQALIDRSREWEAVIES